MEITRDNYKIRTQRKIKNKRKEKESEKSKCTCLGRRRGTSELPYVCSHWLTGVFSPVIWVGFFFCW
ncbi:hypothetical protein L3X38_045129 [Prunus dulcis]|uniref:Uncharacterized protein n=1 Tax=Prunus dulcis TaxID=3755 RepID=A0AAD4YPL6_PRUDU|nr:hypothetical protein L3X38_045129 [Prunus dulcis]